MHLKELGKEQPKIKRVDHSNTFLSSPQLSFFLQLHLPYFWIFHSQRTGRDIRGQESLHNAPYGRWTLSDSLNQHTSSTHLIHPLLLGSIFLRGNQSWAVSHLGSSSLIAFLVSTSPVGTIECCLYASALCPTLMGNSSILCLHSSQNFQIKCHAPVILDMFSLQTPAMDTPFPFQAVWRTLGVLHSYVLQWGSESHWFHLVQISINNFLGVPSYLARGNSSTCHRKEERSDQSTFSSYKFPIKKLF